jgi:hypothetical protein
VSCVIPESSLIFAPDNIVAVKVPGSAPVLVGVVIAPKAPDCVVFVGVVGVFTDGVVVFVGSVGGTTSGVTTGGITSGGTTGGITGGTTGETGGTTGGTTGETDGFTGETGGFTGGITGGT